jgi:hypothetical protein
MSLTNRPSGMAAPSPLASELVDTRTTDPSARGGGGFCASIALPKAMIEMATTKDVFMRVL